MSQFEQNTVDGTSDGVKGNTLGDVEAQLIALGDDPWKDNEEQARMREALYQKKIELAKAEEERKREKAEEERKARVERGRLLVDADRQSQEDAALAEKLLAEIRGKAE